MKLDDLRGQTVAFAASGGLDSCTITRWLADESVRVVCFTADIAQPDESDFDEIGRRMMACGAVDYVRIPLREQIAEAGLSLIRAQACYEGRYWNTTGIGRHVIVAGLVPEMRARGIYVLSHGATGRGNDQVRFQLATNMLAPDMEVYAPWRDEAFLSRFGGRAEMIEYCRQRELPIRATLDAPYSTDANLLGLTHEAGRLESLETPPEFVEPEMGRTVAAAPETAEPFTVRFVAGTPVAINGRKVTPLEAIEEANRVGGRHAVGIGYHLVENRFVGIKSRGVYEAPGMELLGTAYGFLLELILDRRARRLFDQISEFVGQQIYEGYGFDLATEMARAALEPIDRIATGTIAVNLHKGKAGFASATDVPHSLYSEENASMESVGDFDHADSEGFLRVLQVGARAVAAARQVERD